MERDRVPAPGSSFIRVLIVDDHPAICQALVETINHKIDMEVCGQADSADNAFQIAAAMKPDVAVIDLALRDAHGLDLMQNLRAQYPDLQVVIFSMYDENVYAERALRAGASAYVMKNEPTQSVVEAIRYVARGEVYLSRRMASHLLSKVAFRTQGTDASPLSELTDREMEVFQLLGQGHGVPEIAAQLNLSRKTVETYRRRAKEKLGFESVSQLLQHAVKWSLSQTVS